MVGFSSNSLFPARKRESQKVEPSKQGERPPDIAEKTNGLVIVNRREETKEQKLARDDAPSNG